MPSITLSGRAFLRLSGKDAETFLQSLITTNLPDLQENEIRPGALLTPQGKILFDFLIRRDGDMEVLPLAIFATGDTSPAAIRAAAQRDTQVQALACHGGLIDRAGLEALKYLSAPLLMLFDAEDRIGPLAAERAARDRPDDMAA